MATSGIHISQVLQGFIKDVGPNCLQLVKLLKVINYRRDVDCRLNDLLGYSSSIGIYFYTCIISEYSFAVNAISEWIILPSVFSEGHLHCTT